MRSGFSIIVVFIVLAVTGCLLLPLLPVKLFPSAQLPSVSVSFSMQGHSARVVEQEVTCRLEGALSRIEGVKKIESRSANGGGWIRLEIDRHADMEAVRLEASAVVRQLWGSLPAGVSYPDVSVQQVNEDSKGPFMTYMVTSPGNSIGLSSYLEEKVKPVLSDLPGVAQVDVHGAIPDEWRLEYDAHRLQTLGLTPEDVVTAFRRHYGMDFLGVAPLRDGWMRIVKRAPGNADELDLSQMTLTTPSGESVTLDRILTAVRTQGAPQSYFRINGMTSVYLNISAADAANQLEVSRSVVKAMKTIGETAPTDMRFILSNDSTDTIREELSKIYFRTGLTMLILLVFIAVVTRSIRYTLLVVSTLVVNLLIAVIFYWLSATEIQLYSLAGITISLNLIIDNTIVMCDHYVRQKDRRAFPALLAATLTTAGALVVVFLMDDEVRMNLEDFVIVVVVNLAVSLLVALFLVPPLSARLGIKSKKGRRSGPGRKLSYHLDRIYRRYIRFSLRWRWVFLIIMTGGIAWTGYLFFTKVREGMYFNHNNGEKMLYVSASLPNGSTLPQMDALIRRMENFIAGFDEIRQFQSNVYNGQQASITIRFRKGAEHTGFPYRLKTEIVSKALTLGGGSWSVFGLEDNGFNNDVRESSGNMRVKLLGFNYDRLTTLGNNLRDSLLSHRRIKEVEMKADFSWWKEDYSEFSLSVSREALAKVGLPITDFYQALSPLFGRDISCGEIVEGAYVLPVRLSSRQSREYDVWAMRNIPLTIRGKSFKLGDLAVLEKRNAAQDIVKENQSYRLCLQYDYMGSFEQGKKVLDKTLDEFRKTLPPGYFVETDDYSWISSQKDYSRYAMLGVIVLIIFFISAILFNSLLRPIAIIAIIPMSYVGIFSTFYFFDLKFDQGGFASFILLSGITVNAAIYIINEFDRLIANCICHSESRRNISSRLALRLYMHAFRVKIIPVLITVLSTVLGFIPFMVGTGKESFWYPLAAGTIGGLLFSLLAIICYLPLLILKKEKGGGRRENMVSRRRNMPRLLRLSRR